MRLLEITRTYRNLVRLSEIVRVLSRHGFGGLFERVGLYRYVPLLDRLVRRAVSHETGLPQLSVAERAAQAIEELGPTFVKFGQALSTRPDLIPEPFVEQFTRLQDRAKPFPAEKARAVIEADLGRPVDELFARFEDTPAAAGSIGQVHYATLPDGTEVVVKVRRPEEEVDRIRADLDLLHALAELVERHLSDLRVYRPVMVVEEFRRNLLRELDFVAEAATTEKFRRTLGGEGPGSSDGSVLIPAVHWDYTSHAVMTQTRITGTRLSDRGAVEAMGCDRKRLAQTIGRAFMRQYFQTGLFHADPHPGNIFVLDAGRIALLDFGSAGHLTPEVRSQLSTTLIGLAQGDLELIVTVLTDLGLFSETTDLGEVKLDLLELLDRYYGLPTRHVDLGRLFQDIVRLARVHQVLLPRDFVMLGRSLVMVVGLCQQLDPDFDLAESVRPYLKQLILDKIAPKRVLKRLALNAYTLLGLAQSLPRDLKTLTRKALAGQLRVNLEHQGLEEFTREVDRSSNRLAFAIITASIIMGSSLLLANRTPPTLEFLGFPDVSLLGFVGFVIAALLGLRLAWAIYRSGKL